MFNNELVSIMSFSKARKGIGNNVGYEMVRFCAKCSIMGGASKLLKHFIKTINPDIVYSYSLNDYSSGNLYLTLGFKLASESHSNYSYYDSSSRRSLHRLNFTKTRLKKLGYDISKTENDITKELGLIKYYDAGATRWVLEIKENK